MIARVQYCYLYLIEYNINKFHIDNIDLLLSLDDVLVNTLARKPGIGDSSPIPDKSFSLKLLNTLYFALFFINSPT